jgi:hypothetical protein
MGASMKHTGAMATLLAAIVAAGCGACVTLCQLAVGPEDRMYIHNCELTTADGGDAIHVTASGSCGV